MSTSTLHIKSAAIKPGDIIKFEYGDYGNWVTAVIDEVSIDPKVTCYPQKLIWHYLSDEKGASKESKPEPEASKDCRAEKLGNKPQTNKCPYRQFTCYGNLNDLVEKLN